MKNTLRRIKHRAQRMGLKYKIYKLNDTVEYIGTEYGGFYICADLINSDSIVYSFGIGEDISFDVGMIEKFGCRIYAFDPTPKSIEWLKKQDLPNLYTYKEIGLSDEDGDLVFAKPQNPDFVSVSSVLNNYQNTERIKLPVMKLRTIMDTYGHKKIDVLKMDIEGTEYRVLDNLLEEEIEVKQILVEFHHRFKGVGYDMTNSAIEKLTKAGYVMFSISDTGEEMSFVLEKSLRSQKCDIRGRRDVICLRKKFERNKITDIRNNYVEKKMTQKQ